jgi:hypothetical protein
MYSIKDGEAKRGGATKLQNLEKPRHWYPGTIRSEQRSSGMKRNSAAG